METPFSRPHYINSEHASKKRKRTLISHASSSEDLDHEEQRSSTIDVKRQVHSNIEKRRRDKMNSYIMQLSSMIPMHSSSSQKLDKITVLRLTVQYLKSIRVSPMQFEENLKYSFVSDLELRKLILQQVSEGFLFVVNCESAKIQYVSPFASKIFKCNYANLLGRSLYDVIHPHDVDKVKEQISCVDLNPRHKLMGSKPSKDLEVEIPSEQLGTHSGHRRSFFFRVKTDLEEPKKILDAGKYSYPNYKNTEDLLLLNENFSEQNKYTTIQCIGYLKCWNKMNHKIKIMEDMKDTDASFVTSLVAIGRAVDNVDKIRQMGKPVTFISKYAIDGKFLFVDHWLTMVTGYLPQEILGTNIYDYIHTEDVNVFMTTHQSMLQYPNNTVISNNYRFRTKFGSFIKVQSEWKSLLNPWKEEIEYYYSKNTVSWPKDMEVINFFDILMKNL